MKIREMFFEIKRYILSYVKYFFDRNSSQIIKTKGLHGVRLVRAFHPKMHSHTQFIQTKHLVGINVSITFTLRQFLVFDVNIIRIK